ncbi:polysaccharide biosynthesis/export family protein [Uruburuella testudinis]|uniref:Polysaccharide biosynthesis/export family protein n=1 Tax=Uruburuella testudinis TaxID=1282863 RepID=A0ABY4E2N9_9NEIS|nr:polysaccharide export protein [Uruburuella testudinis]UOO83181.1 polysaccharide biosynthesis/export family protein [Uruburuella testudinis]
MKQLTVIGFSLLALTAGCTVIPGSGLPTKNKTVVYHENDSADSTLDSRVNLYPITLSLVESMRQPPRFAQNNNALNAQKAGYRYRVGSGDVLNIAVWAHADLNTPAPTSSINPQSRQVSNGIWVDEAGYLFYPLAGKMLVRGKTLPEVQNMLTGRLKRYIKNPQVSVNVTEFRSQRVTVSGAVGQAGQLPITNIPVTLLDAIDLAGGVAENADTRHIKWTHNGVDSTISLQDILQYGDLSQNHLLSHGDIVYVPTTENSKVYVMGEVGRQSALRMGNHGLTLTQALGDTGGMSQAMADASGVFVIRNAPADHEKPIHVYQLNLKDATAYALGNQFRLQPEDVVYITAAPVTRWNRVISQLTNSISNVNALDDTFQ